MHEYGIVQSLIEAASQEAAKRHAISVKSLTLALGEQSGVEPELLKLAWQTFRERTPCEGAHLTLRSVPVVWRCPRCEGAIPPGSLLRCPVCAVPARMIAGDEMILERIELEVPDV